MCAARRPPAEESCLDAIRSAYGELPRGERLVADYAMATPEIVYQSITEVVELSGAGYGTVMRFCKRLGCAGFQEFKVRLARDPALRQAPAESSDDDVLAVAARGACDDIRATEQALSRRDLERAAAAIAGAGTVLVAGVGGSASTVVELEFRLTRLGIATSGVADPHMARIRAAALGKKDVAILVSFSGATRDLLAAASVARRAGATVVCITNHRKSPLCEKSHWRLLTAIAADAFSSEIAPRAAIAFLADALSREVAARRKGSTKMLEKTMRADADAQL